MIGIEDCNFFAAYPEQCLLRIDHKQQAMCGQCGAVVYPHLAILARHDITGHADNTCTWWSRDLQAFTHRCGEQTETDWNAELIALSPSLLMIGDR